MQEKYLIHIRPPGDVMPDAFREIVRLQNATNAAILYDDSFGEMLIEMYHIYTKIILFTFM